MRGELAYSTALDSGFKELIPLFKSGKNKIKLVSCKVAYRILGFKALVGVTHIINPWES